MPRPRGLARDRSRRQEQPAAIRASASPSPSVSAPGEGGAQVRVVGGDHGHPLGLARSFKVGFGLLGEGQVVVTMGRTVGRLLVGLGQTARRVVPQGFQQPVAGLSPLSSTRTRDLSTSRLSWSRTWWACDRRRRRTRQQRRRSRSCQRRPTGGGRRPVPPR